MFPYPSGAGLHVGHPLGYLGTDVTSRFRRMDGDNVLHPMGYDAFGLPAEQYAVQTGQHPRITTEANIAAIRAQLRRLGVDHDDRRSLRHHRPGLLQVDPVDLPADLRLLVRRARRARRGGSRSWSPSWTPARGSPRPGTNPLGRPWAELDEVGRRLVVDAHRLAYLHQAPVNWCPGPGHGALQRGGHRRRALRAGQLPGVPAPADPVDDADHRLRRPAARRPGPAGLVGLAEADAAQLDRPLDRRADRLRRRRRDRRGLHHPARHAVRRHLHGAGARAPAGRCADRRRPGPTAPTRAGPAERRPRPRRSRPTSGRPPAAPSWTARPRAATRPASGWASPPSTRSTAASCRCSSPTTC